MFFNEWIRNKNGIFTEMLKIGHLSFFSDYSAKNIDTLYKIKYGSRTIAKNIVDLTPLEVAHILVAVYGEKWNNKYALLKGMEMGVDSKTIVEENINDDVKRVSSSNQTNQVSAFNDIDVATNDVQVDTVNDDVKKDTTKNTVKTHKSMNAIKTQLDLLNSNFIDDVLQDVNKIVFLSIYE